MHTIKHMESNSNKEAQSMEKAYRTMKSSGTGNIVVGIIILVLGITAGVISIVNGASLLRNKKEITF